MGRIIALFITSKIYLRNLRFHGVTKSNARTSNKKNKLPGWVDPKNLFLTVIL